MTGGDGRRPICHIRPPAHGFCVLLSERGNAENQTTADHPAAGRPQTVHTAWDPVL